MHGWRLTLLLSVLLVAMSAVVLLEAGTGEPGVRSWIRATARSSVVLFLLAFVSRPLRQFWRSALSAWLLRNRRYLGVSFAVSHFLHMCGLVWFGVIFTESYRAEVAPSTVILGGIGFALAYAMAATSSDAMQQRLGRDRWRVLHRTGSWVLWVIFLFTFGGVAAARPTSIYLLATGALIAAAGLRMAAWARRRRAEPRGAPA